MFFELIKDQLNGINMNRFIDIDQDDIPVNNYKYIKFISQDLINMPL